MISTRFGTLRGSGLRGAFHHRLHLKFREWNDQWERKNPEEGVEEGNEIYHINTYIRLKNGCLCGE